MTEQLKQWKTPPLQVEGHHHPGHQESHQEAQVILKFLAMGKSLNHF